VVYGGGGGGSISQRSVGTAGAGGLGGGGAGGAFGWELRDASGVGRQLSWRLFTHSRSHPNPTSPSAAADFDKFFDPTQSNVTLARSGTVTVLSQSQSATGNASGSTVNVLNWAGNSSNGNGPLYDVIGRNGATPDQNFAFEVSGWFVPRETGTYHFTVESDDAGEIRIGSTVVAAFYGPRGISDLGSTFGPISLTAGQAYLFRARMEEGNGAEGLRVFWQTPSQRSASTTIWWQNADELLGDTPSGSPLNGAELGRFTGAARRYATERGLGTLTTQTHGSVTTSNTLNWTRSADGTTNELALPGVIGVAGLGNDFMVATSGTFVPSETGTYTFALSGDDAVDLAVNGSILVSHYGQKAAAPLGTHTGIVSMTAGVPVHLAVRHHQRDGGAALRVFWRKPSQTIGWFQDDTELRASGRNGVDGLGGGGGAGGHSGFVADPNGQLSDAPGGRGGDGVVIVRYPLDRLVTGLPSEVRDAIAGEGETTAVMRWRVPQFSPPSASLAGYRIEYAPVSGGDWVALDDDGDIEFSISGDTVAARLTDIPSTARHRFRITPLGSVDGPSTIVEPIAKGGATVTLVGDDVVHAYTSVGSSGFSLAQERRGEVLVVAGGGGGGGRSWAGGGGGGGVLYGQDVALLPGPVVVIVGGGGTGGEQNPADPAARSGQDGGPSSFGQVTAPGGGGGGGAGWNTVTYAGQGRTGGSGGGTGEHGSTAAYSGTLLYEVSTPTRASGAITYRAGFGTGAGDAAATFDGAGTPITSVTYRMQVAVSGTVRFAEVTFDPWSGLTARDLRVPDLLSENRFVLRRFVSNMRVDSNMAAGTSTKSTGVVNGAERTGYLEIWPWDYTTATVADGPAGSGTTYDVNDTHAGTRGYGSFQVHDVTDAGSARTVLAWNNHAVSNPDIGLGSYTGNHPDWTFAGNDGLGTTSWRLDIRANRDPWQELAGGSASIVAPPGWTAYGNAGGTNAVLASQAGSGGGGAGAAGGTVPITSRQPIGGVTQPRVAGDGGTGAEFSITGAGVVYAGGGGGATQNDGTDICSAGGIGGGGAGACAGTGGSSAQVGTPGLGGGGGGGHNSSGAAGGSGTVIVRYPFYVTPPARGGDVVYDILDGGIAYRVHEFRTVGTSTLEVLRDTDVEYLVVGAGASGTRGQCTVYFGHGGGG
jgi:hypothetical protein